MASSEERDDVLGKTNLTSLYSTYAQVLDLAEGIGLSDFLKENPAATSQEKATLACMDMHHQWRLGRSPTARQYLQQIVELQDDVEKVVDLTFTEYLERVARGEAPKMEELSSDPAVQELLVKQIQLHDALFDRDKEEMSLDAIPQLEFSKETTTHNQRRRRNEPRKPNIPGFEILQQIGVGGVGVVYKAVDIETRQLFAIKVLNEKTRLNLHQIKRLKREALAVANLRHPNIVKVHDIGESDGVPYLLLEYMNAGSLAHFRCGTPLPSECAATLMLQIVRAVVYFHQHGIVHRDLKPANILLAFKDVEFDANQSTQFLHDSFVALAPLPKKVPPRKSSKRKGERERTEPPFPDVTAKIADFGFAKIALGIDDSVGPHTRSGDIIGTPCYMSPEQASGDIASIGPPSDIYSLGAIMYELITGKPPVIGATVLETIQMVQHREVVHPSKIECSIPQDLEAICLKCLEKKASHRYSSAKELGDDLTAFLENRAIKARRISQLELLWRWSQRNPSVAILSAIVLFLLLGVASISSVAYFQVKQQLALTESAKRESQQASSEAVQQLWNSLLSEVEVRRNSRRIGQRFAALDSLHRAQELRHDIAFSDLQRLEIQNRAVACLAVPDIDLIAQWNSPVAGISQMATDQAIERYAIQLDSGIVEVRESQTGFLIARTDALPPRSFISMSPEGDCVGVQNERFSLYPVASEPGKKLKPTWSLPSGGAWSFIENGASAIGTLDDGTLVVVTTANGEVTKRLGRHFGNHAIDVNERVQLAASVYESELRIVDLKTGQVKQVLPAPDRFDGLQNLSWSEDGTQLAAGPYDNSIRIWNIADGSVTSSFRHIGPAEIHLDLRGEVLIGFNPATEVLNIWNLASRQPLLSALNFHYVSAQRTEDGEFKMLVVDKAERKSPSKLQLHQIVTGQILRGVHAELQPIGLPTHVAFSNDLSSILARGTDSSLVLNTTTLKREPSLPLRFSFEPVVDLADEVSPDDFRFQLSSDGRDQERLDRSIAVPANETEFRQFLTVNQATHFEITPDGWGAALARPGEVFVWRQNGTQTPLRLAEPLEVQSLEFSADRKWLAIGGSNGSVHVWEISSGKLVAELVTEGVCLASFSDDSRYLASTGDGGVVWDTSNWRVCMRIESADTTMSGLRIRFTPDSQQVVISTSDGCFRFLNISDGRETMSLTDPENRPVVDFTISADGSKLAACIQEGASRVVVWDLKLLKARIEELGFDYRLDPLAL